MRYMIHKQLQEVLEPVDLKTLIAKDINGLMRICLLALSHLKSGANRAQTAICVKVSRKVVNDGAKKD
jgi:hypothetical protein